MSRIRHPPLDEADRLDAALAVVIVGGGFLTIIVIALVAFLSLPPGA